MKLIFTSLIFLVLFPCQVFSQFTLKGIVRDSITGKPIPYTTIYENGTTNGTISNTEGKFQLNIESKSCKVIFSCVGYLSKKITFQNQKKGELTILLTHKVVDLQEVSIVNSDRRKKNVEIFKKCFLGSDYWGENAILENDSALIFSPEYFPNQTITETTKNKKANEKDAWIKEIQKLKKLEVHAREPLQIFLPLLGYHMHVDLVNYKLAYDSLLNIYSNEYLGYFFYTPDSIAKKSVQRKIRKNREKAYYHSPMHFYRALYENKIVENGYIVYDIGASLGRNVYADTSARFNFSLAYPDLNSAEIYGLKGVELHILYSDSFGKPIDLTKDVYRNYYFSKIRFMSDTVTIRKDGTISNNLIMFQGMMGKKLIGASLPRDCKIE